MHKFINKKYKNRHIILETLQRRYEEVYNPTMQDGELEIDFKHLVEYSKLTNNEVYEQLDYLHLENEISIDEIQFQIYYIILRNGSKAYYDKKYITIGIKEFHNNFYDILKNISSVILLIIAIITFILNSFATIKLKEQVSKLQIEVQTLKNK